MIGKTETFTLLIYTVLSSSWAGGSSEQTGQQYLRNEISSDPDGRRLCVNCWLLLPHAVISVRLIAECQPLPPDWRAEAVCVRKRTCGVIKSSFNGLKQSVT